MRLTIMTPKRLRMAALVLFVLALFFAWLGFQSQPQSSQVDPYSPSAQPKPSQYTVWKVTQNIMPGQKLTQDDVEAVNVSQVSGKQIQDIGAVMSLRAKHTIIASTIVTLDMFEIARPIADELPVGYRALAVTANEVLTVGGHLQPGDKVDVIYLLRPNIESGKETTVRRLASNIEVLAVGSQVSELNPDKPANIEIKSNAQSKQQSNKVRSVVLAVEEKLAPTILLAESSGDLRLSMIGRGENFTHLNAIADEEIVEQTTTQTPMTEQSQPDNYLVSLDQFKTEPQPTRTTKKTTSKNTSPARAHYIEIIQGDKRTWVNSGK